MRKFKLLFILLTVGLLVTGCGEKKLEKISLSVDKLISINETREIKVAYDPESVKEEIIWSSSNEEIASVSNGIITAKSIGNVTITATTTSGIKNQVNIEVYQKVESLMLDKSNVELYVGDTSQVTVTITPEEATYKEITWTSSNNSIVSVENGLITAKDTGEAIITATTKDGVSQKCNVIVKEKPIEFSGSGDKIISNVNIPRGEYIARITVNSTRHYAIKFYYGSSDYDYELLVNNSGKAYAGTTFLKGGSIDAVNNGMFEINAQGPWTIKVEKLTGTATFPITGNGDMVTGLFEGSGSREVFNITYNSTRHHAVKIYKYNGSEYDYELLVNDSGKAYNGQVMAPTEKGAKYFFVVEGEGDWTISKD